uniref:Glycogen debranching enzyme C-terminal domain-containing protein n=1 Tax=Glossina austeni TaxID=7395 RepID=A0A1A9UWF1_GLOAU
MDDEARFIILGFAQCLRHGLIPNLLDNGVRTRDAVWWWLSSIKQYVEQAPQGAKILKDKVSQLQTTHWRRLPQLTNENDAFCRDSCPTQAWSIVSIMEMLYDLHSLGGDV